MKAKLAIWMPTYKRPHVLSSVAKNLEDSTKHPFTLYFGLEPEDTAGIKAAKATGHMVIINKFAKGYAGTIQSIYEDSDEPFWMHANDDFVFFSDWDETPLSMFENPAVKVVGLRQTESDNHGSAVCMARRSYIEEESGVIDMPNQVFYPYNHNYIDTEFTATAQKRGVWAKCDKQVIDHRHPGLTGVGEKDATYQKNDATAELDKNTFLIRKHLWENL
jgi:hypothetical protein